MAYKVVGKPVLEKISHLLAVPSDFERAYADVPKPCPISVGIVALCADGIGLPAVSVGVVESPSNAVVYAWISGKKVDTYREEAKSDSCGCASVAISVVGTGNARDALTNVEHIVVLVGGVAIIRSEDNGIGGLMQFFLREGGAGVS